jgi:DNA polymerase family A
VITIRVDTMMPGDYRYVPVHVVSDPDGTNRCYEWLIQHSGQRLALDIETNARIPQEQGFACRTLQFSDGIDAWFIDVDAVGVACASNLINAPNIQWVAHFTGLAEIAFIHNGLPGCTASWGEWPKILENQTLLAHYDPRTLCPPAKVSRGVAHTKGLKDTVTRELSPALKLIESDLHAWFKDHAPVGQRVGKKLTTWGFANVPTLNPIYITYAVLDAVFLARLWAKEYAEIQRRGQWLVDIVEEDLIVQWDIQCADVIRGLPIDAEYARWLDDQLAGTVAINAEFLAGYGIGESAQGPAVKAAFEGIARQCWDAGQQDEARLLVRDSYDKANLVEIVEQSRIPGGIHLAELLLTVRRAGKFRGTYTKAMLDSLGRDGKLHSQVLACGTVTHRMSSSQPNIQNLPKKDTRVRAAFGGVPGWVFVSCDFAQGEPRTMAAASGDPNLIADVLSGDINNATATAAFGDRFDPTRGKQAGTAHYLMRQGAKAGFLAVCYAVGLTTLAATMSLPIEHTRRVLNAWKQRYRVAFGRAEHLNNQACVRLLNGRVIPLWDRYIVHNGQLVIVNKPSRKSLNYETQGQQRDYLIRAWMRLRTRGWAGYLALFLHDEIILFVPEHLAEQAKSDLAWAMTFELANGITMECEATIDGRTMMSQPKDFDLRELVGIDQEDVSV